MTNCGKTAHLIISESVPNITIRVDGLSIRLRFFILMSCINPYPPIVFDIGSGYTKMGYSNNCRPNFIIPTIFAERKHANHLIHEFHDLDFFIGDEGLSHSSSYFPISFKDHFEIQNWNFLEQFLEHCFFKYLRCDPEDHPILIAEPNINTPENREFLAEILFETFNIPYLYIESQAMFAIVTSWNPQNSTERSLTGTVVDSGESFTQICSMIEGYPIQNATQSVPIAGHAMTTFIANILKDREPTVPPEDRMSIAKRIKETLCRFSDNVPESFKMFDQNRKKYVQKFTGKASRTGRDFTCEVGYERFLSPQIFFSPELVSNEYTTPISVLIDRSIQMCPLTDRRRLYDTIVLSGGNTVFPGFAKRLQREVQLLVTQRLEEKALL
jgi:actin-related protein 3